MCAVLSSAKANEWSFVPFAGVSEQYTDNAYSTSSDAHSDLITSLDVGFDITGETLRSELSLSYSINQDYYAHAHELDGYRQNLIGIGNIELLSDKLFVDSRITFTEETLSQAGASSATGRTLSSDRTQVLNGQISPYYIHRFGSFMTGIARYSYSQTIFSEPEVGASTSAPDDTHTNEYQLDLNSGRRFSKFKWFFENGSIASESENGDSFVHLSSFFGGETPINRYFSIIATVGYDDFDADDIDDDDVSGLAYGAGLRFHPNSRTDLSFQVGRRFNDTVFDMNASYAPTSRDTVSASYNVSIQTAEQSLVNTELLDAQGEIVRPDFNVNGYVDEISKSKTFALNWNGSRGRNNYGLSGNLIEREFLDTNSEDLALSVSANIGRQLTPRALLSLSTSYTEVIEGQTAADEDVTNTFGVNYSYEFKNGLTGNASYNFINRDSKVGSDLRENAITVSVRKSF